MPYVFLSHQSACEVLRKRGTDGSRWPDEGRLLPIWGDCVAGQRQMAALEKDVDLVSFGAVSRPLDVLVPTSGYRTRGKRARTHVWSGAVPTGSMIRVHPRVLVSGPEFTLLQLSHVHNMHWPQYEAVVDRYWEEREMLERYGYEGKAVMEKPLLWEPVRSLVGIVRLAMEFAGTYRLGATTEEEATYGRPSLMTIESAATFAEGVNRHRASGQMLRALDLALPNSWSPRETDLALMLTLPVELGGYGLARPQLNVMLDAPSTWSDLMGERKITPDMLWENERLVVEYDGHRSHRDAGVSKTDRDIMRANTLRAMGYTVLEVTYGTVETLARMDSLAGQVAACLRSSLPKADEDALMVRRHLFDELFALNIAEK